MAYKVHMYFIRRLYFLVFWTDFPLNGRRKTLNISALLVAQLGTERYDANFGSKIGSALELLKKGSTRLLSCLISILGTFSKADDDDDDG